MARLSSVAGREIISPVKHRKETEAIKAGRSSVCMRAIDRLNTRWDLPGTVLRCDGVSRIYGDAYALVDVSTRWFRTCEGITWTEWRRQIDLARDLLV